MSPKISLREFIDQMDYQTDELHSYINKQTGKMVTVSDEEIRIVERDSDQNEYPAWQHSAIEEAKQVLENDDYLPLPSKFDIHEYLIMNRFCFSIEDEDISEELLSQIRGRGAFRRFKNAIYQCNLADDWHKYRQEAFMDIAIGWLEANGIEYINDIT